MHSKGNYKQSEKETLRMGENNSKWNNWQKINFKNIQAAHTTPRVTKIKTKINKWDLIKLKNFCTAKEIINKMKKQSSGWEKIFANEATDKGLVSKIYK